MDKRNSGLNIIFAVMLSAIFCVAGFGILNTKTQKSVVLAETSVQEQTLLKSEFWEDYTTAPAGFGSNVENIGSISGKKIEISAPEELAWIAVQVNNSSTTYKGFEGYTIELIADINLAGKFWTPIGIETNLFRPLMFNGNGHRISGMTFETYKDDNALISYWVNGGIYKDIIIDGTINAAQGLTHVDPDDKNNGGLPEPTIINCFSFDVPLTNGDGNSDSKILHSKSSNGNLKPSSLGDDDNPIGLNQFYYLVEREGATNNIKGTKALVDTNLTIDKFWADTETITKLEIFEYQFTGSTMDWNKVVSYQTSNYGQTSSFADGLSIGLAPLQTKRSYSKMVNINGTNQLIANQDIQGLDDLNNITISYARQSAIKIVLTIETRKVKINAVNLQAFNYKNSSLYNDGGVGTFSAIKGAYEKPNGIYYVSNLLTNLNSVTGMSLPNEFNEVINGEEIFVDYGTEFSLSADNSKVLGFTCDIYDSSRTESLCYSAGSWQTEEGSFSISLGTAGEHLSVNVNILLKNIFKVILNNTNLLEDVKEFGGVNLTYLTISGSQEAYLITDIKSPDATKGMLVHNLKDADNYSNWNDWGIRDVYVYPQDVSEDSMNGTNIFESTPQILSDKLQIFTNTSAALSANYSGWEEVSDESNLYIAWVLGTSNITLYNGTGKVLAPSVYNPYTGDTNPIGESIGSSAVYSIANTYTIISLVYESEGKLLSDGKTLHVQYLTGDKDNNGLVTPFKCTKWFTAVGGIVYGEYKHGAFIRVLGDEGYNFSLTNKEIKIKIVATLDGKNGAKIGDLISSFTFTDNITTETFSGENWIYDEDDEDKLVLQNNYQISANFEYSWNYKDNAIHSLKDMWVLDPNGDPLSCKDKLGGVLTSMEGTSFQDGIGPDKFRFISEELLNKIDDEVVLVLQFKEGRIKYNINFVDQRGIEVGYVNITSYYKNGQNVMDYNNSYDQDWMVTLSDITMDDNGLITTVSNFGNYFFADLYDLLDPYGEYNWAVDGFDIDVKHKNNTKYIYWDRLSFAQLNEDGGPEYYYKDNLWGECAIFNIKYWSYADSFDIGFDFRNFPYYESSTNSNGTIGYSEFDITVTIVSKPIPVAFDICFTKGYEEYVADFDVEHSVNVFTDDVFYYNDSTEYGIGQYTLNDGLYGDYVNSEDVSVGDYGIYYLDGSKKVFVYINNILSYYDFGNGETKTDSGYIGTVWQRDVYLCPKGVAFSLETDYKADMRGYNGYEEYNEWYDLVQNYNNKLTEDEKAQGKWAYENEGYFQTVDFVKYYGNDGVYELDLNYFYINDIWFDNLEDYYSLANKLSTNGQLWTDDPFSVYSDGDYSEASYHNIYIIDEDGNEVVFGYYSEDPNMKQAYIKYYYADGREEIKLVFPQEDGINSIGDVVSNIFTKNGYTTKYKLNTEYPPYAEEAEYTSASVILDIINGIHNNCGCIEYGNYEHSTYIDVEYEQNKQDVIFETQTLPTGDIQTLKFVYNQTNWSDAEWWKEQWTDVIKTDGEDGKTLTDISKDIFDAGYFISTWKINNVVIANYTFDGSELKYEFTENIDWLEENVYQYEITCVQEDMFVTFDKTYIGGTNKKVNVVYGTNNLSTKDIPETPTRVGYKFVYWGADFSGENGSPKYIIYGDVDPNTLDSVIDKSGLTFYAVWDVVGINISLANNEVTKTYSSQPYSIEFTISNVLDNMLDNLSSYIKLKKYISEEYIDITDNGVVKAGYKTEVDSFVINSINADGTAKATLNLKYYDHSGKYRLEIDYAFDEDDSASSTKYINNDTDYSAQASRVLTVAINKAQLEFDSDVKKTYDGTTAIDQLIKGIYNDEISVIPAYEDANVGKEKVIKYEVICNAEVEDWEKELIKNSYILPKKDGENVTGEITCYGIDIDLTGTATQSLSDIVILNVTIDGNGAVNKNGTQRICWNVNTSDFTETFKNTLNALATKFGTMTLKLTINGESSVYNSDRVGVEFEIKDKTGADITSNFELKFINSFEVVDVPNGFNLFEISAVRDDAGAISDVTREISLNEIAGANESINKVNNYQIEYLKVYANAVEFTIDITFANANWWVKEFTYKIKDGEVITQKLVEPLYENGEITISLSGIETDKIYQIQIIFTETSIVTFELGLLYEETGYSQPQNITIKYSQDKTFELPNATRKALTLTNWLHIDSLGNKTTYNKQTSFTLSSKGDTTIYALWTFSATIKVNGQNISAEYNFGTTYKLEAEIICEEQNTALETFFNLGWYRNKTTLEEESLSYSVSSPYKSGNYHFALTLADDAKIKNDIQVISENITYTYLNNPTQDASYPTGYYYSVEITPANITLTNVVEIPYSGYKVDYTYSLTEDDFEEESFKDLFTLVSHTIKITNDSHLEAGEEFTFTGKPTGLYAGYCSITVNCKIVPLDVTLEIDTAYTYDGSVPAINPDSINFNCNNITFKTLLVSPSDTAENTENKIGVSRVGTYEYLFVSENFEAETSSYSSSISNFNFIFKTNSKIVITGKAFNGQLNINNTTLTYNAQNQKFGVEVKDENGNDITNESTITIVDLNNNRYEYTSYAGIKDVGSYKLLVVVSHGNYVSNQTINLGENNAIEGMAYQEITFKIDPYTAYVYLTDQSGLTKIYDGNQKLALKHGQGYTIYGSNPPENLNEAIVDVFLKELNGELDAVPTNWWFNLNGKNAGEVEISGIGVNTTSNIAKNYKLELVNTQNYKATISKKDVTITIKQNVEKDYDGDAFVCELDQILVSGLLNTEELVSGSTIKFTNAIVPETYEFNNATTGYDISGMTIKSEGLLSKNYSIETVNGVLVINKKKVNLTFEGTYKYCGNQPEIKYTATCADEEDVKAKISYSIDYSEVENGDKFYVGNGYKITFKIEDDEDKNYYTFVYKDDIYELTDQFEITEKNVEINIEASKIFDGTIFVLNLMDFYNNNPAVKDWLAEGHSFNKDGEHTSTIRTNGYWVFNYKGNTYLTADIKVFDQNTEVTSNYQFTISDTCLLKIQQRTLSDDDIELSEDPYIYNGSSQNISFKLMGKEISFNGNRELVEEIEYDGTTITTKISFLRMDNNGNYSEDDFKYASTYEVRIESDLFANDYSFEVVMNQLVITKDNIEISVDGEAKTINEIDSLASDEKAKYLNKQYDGTTTFVNDISINNICGGNESMVGLTLVYANTIGLCQIVGSLTYTTTNELLKNSYKLESGIIGTGEIEKRDVEIEYVGSNNLYYTAEIHELNISRFNVKNSLASETFGGNLVFDSMMDAEDYNIEGKNYTGLTLKKGNEDISSEIESHYNIAFTGTVTINKAQIIVGSITNNSVSYDATIKAVTITAKIYAGLGKIETNNAQTILTAKYKLNTEAGFVDAINAGSYYIYPEIAGTYVDNYEYVGDEYVADRLTINKITAIISINKQLTNNGRTEYSFEELDATTNGLISGHEVSGNIKIATDDGVYTYITTGISDNINGIQIISIYILSPTDVTNNYNIKYDIKITLTSEVQEGQVRVKIDDSSYIYDGENQIGTIEVIFETKISGAIVADTISSVGTEGNYGKLIGFYSTQNDAQNNANALDSIINAGTYYACVWVKNLDTGVINENNILVEFVISKKLISNIKLNGNVFNGSKTYDAKVKNELTSDDILEGDIVIINANFFNANNNEQTANVGLVNVSIELSGDQSENYNLLQTTMSGSINPKTITISNVTTENKIYSGTTQNIEITSSDLEFSGLIDGQELSGNITVSALNATKYYINGENATSALVIKDNGGADVTGNYSFEYQTENTGDKLYVEVVPFKVYLAWSEELTYNSFDQTSYVTSNLSYLDAVGGNDIKSLFAGINLDPNLMFSYTNNLIPSETTTQNQIIGAGTYVITSCISKSGNFEYILDIDNSGTIEEVESITILVNQKYLEIDLQAKEVPYLEYKQQHALGGYSLTEFNIIDGLCLLDLTAVQNSKYCITGEYKANNTYKYAEGQIKVDFDSSLSNNYDINVTNGEITLLAETLEYTKELAYEYDGEDKFDNFTINVTDESGTQKTLTKTSTDGKIIGAYDYLGTEVTKIINAGTYAVKFEFNTAEYVVQITINPKTISSFNNLTSYNKTYDGNDVVYNLNGENNLNSDQIVDKDKDSITITAKYLPISADLPGYYVGEHLIEFDINSNNYALPTNVYGEISPKSIEISLGKLELQYNDENVYSVNANSVVLEDGDEVSDSVIKLTFQNNQVNTELVIKTIDLTGFKIDRSGINVTDCYDLSVTLDSQSKIIAKEFKVDIEELPDNKTQYNAQNQYIKYQIGADNELSQYEKETILESIQAVYTKNGEVTQPKNAGSYKVSLSCELENYELVEVTNFSKEYDFEITKYTYTINSEAEIDNFTKQYGIADLDEFPNGLTQTFEVDFGRDGEADEQFTVTYERSGKNDDGKTDARGKYDLVYSSIDNPNIEFNANVDYLAEKFEIIQNSRHTATIEVTGHKDENGLIKYYEQATEYEIDDINDLTFTAKIGSENVDIGSLSGSVIYGAGSIGKYDITESSINTSSANYTNIVVVTSESGKLEIKPRGVTISVGDNKYDKYYDGTTLFLGAIEYTFEYVTQGALSGVKITALSEEITNSLVISYEGINAGSQKVLATYKEGANKNFKFDPEIATGEIYKAKINVNITPGQKAVYGDISRNDSLSLEYNVTYADDVPDNNRGLTTEQLLAAVKVDLEDKEYSSANYLKAKEYNIVASLVDDTNFEIVNNSNETFEVSQKIINVTFTETPYKVQDGTNILDISGLDKGTDYTISEEMAGDDVEMASAHFDTSYSGTNKTIYIIFGGVDGGNYTATAKGDIGPKIIKFNFIYYHDGCNTLFNETDIKQESTTTTEMSVNYYSAVGNNLPTPLFKNNGYKFKGWSTSTDAGNIINKATPINEYISDVNEVNLFAIWEKGKFNVTIEKAIYDITSGQYNVITSSSPQKYEYLSEINMKTLGEGYAGYTYVGFGIGGTNVINTDITFIVQDSDVTLYLMYTPEQATITFNSNGGRFVNNNAIFTYDNNKAQIKIYNGQKLGDILTEQQIKDYLKVTKTGYTFEGWIFENNDYTSSALLDFTISGSATFDAKLTPNEYTLTLDSDGGEFTNFDGWTEVDGSNGAQIKTTIKYNDNLPTLPEPTKKGYIFNYYKDELNQEWAKTTWNNLNNITLKAVYEEADFKLIINATNVTISVSAKSASGANISISDINAEANIYEYNVKTTYIVTITAEANTGYENEGFYNIDDVNVGDGTLTISSFEDNVELTAKAEPKENTITIMVNNPNAGTVESTSHIITDNKIMATTESSVNLKAIANEGYEFDRWSISESATIEATQETTLSKFNKDIIVTAIFKPLKLKVTVINTDTLGNYFYSGLTYSDAEKIFEIETENNMAFVISPKSGYDLESVTFIQTIGSNSGSIQIEQKENKYNVTLSGITTGGTLTISYKIKQYTISIGYAEYNEVTGNYEPTAVAGNIVKIGEDSYVNGIELTYDYNTELTITSDFSKVGFKFKDYVYYDGAYKTFGISVNKQDKCLTLKVTDNYSIYLVYEREEYTVSFEVNNKLLGEIGYTKANEVDFKPLEKLTQKVRYGRSLNVSLTARINSNYKDYITFNGWKVKDQTDYVSEDFTYEFNISSITNDVTYIAEFIGDECEVNVVIKSNGKLQIAESLEVLKFEGKFYTYSAKDKENGDYFVDENGNYIIKVVITCNLFDTISFKLNNIEDYFIKDYFAIDQDKFYSIEELTPTSDAYLNGYIIDISLETYNVTLKVEDGFEQAIKSLGCKVESVGLDTSKSNFTRSETTLAVANMQYGGTLLINAEVNRGYSYNKEISIEGSAEVDFDSLQNATISNITQDVVVTIIFVKTRYEVTFKTNYPTSYNLGENKTSLSSVVNKDFTFYIDQDGQNLEDINGNILDTQAIQSLLYAQDYTTSSAYADKKNGGIMFMFNGWSITQSGGTLNTRFDVDENNCIKNVKTQQEGFNYELTGFETVNGGFVEVTLYGAWSIPTANVSIKFLPELEYNNKRTDLINSGTGVLKDTNQDTISAVLGATIKMENKNIPTFEGYTYFGWAYTTGSIENIDRGEISNGEITFLMPSENVTIVIFYQFKVTVKVEEAISGSNGIKVNNNVIEGDLIELDCLYGDEISLEGIVGKGFEWSCWLQGQTNISNEQQTTIGVYNTTIFTAVFIGKQVKIELGEVEHVTLEPHTRVARVGEKITIKRKYVEYGYVLQGISINGNTNGISSSPAGDEYYYIVAIEDSEEYGGLLQVDAIVAAKEVIVEYKLNIANSAEITVNGEKVTNASKSYKYNDTIIVNVQANTRYELVSIKQQIGPDQTKDLQNSLSFSLTLNKGNGFDISSQTEYENIITFELKQLYWIDVCRDFGGDGSDVTPFIITSAETLAKMAVLINSGELDQSFVTYHFKVMANIDLTNRFWIPIGTEENPFNGIFDLGSYKITGAYHAETYTVLNWNEYACRGVFGYLGDNADIIIERSSTPTIILIVVIASIVVIAGVVMSIIIVKKRKKNKKHIDNLVISKGDQTQSTEFIEQEIDEQENINSESKNLDQEVQEILNRAKAEQNKDNKD